MNNGTNDPPSTTAPHTAPPTPVVPAPDPHFGVGDRRLAELAGAVAGAAPGAAGAVHELVDYVASLRGRAAHAQVDADRKVRHSSGHLDRVFGELLRRGVATDLVPQWWRGEKRLAADAHLRAGWPEHVALADRARELEELLRASQAREDDAHERRHGAEYSRDYWAATARRLGYQPRPGDPTAGAGEEAGDPRIAAEARLRRRLREAESEAAAWALRAEALAELVRMLPRLPVAPKKLRPAVRGVLGFWAIRPSYGHPVALPPEVVGEVCRLAVEDEVEHLRATGATFDAARFRAGALAVLAGDAGGAA
jgi:hypothetical protein